jgi:hypothetical protein
MVLPEMKARDLCTKDMCCDIESVTIDLPVQVLKFLKAHESELGMTEVLTVKGYIEKAVLQTVAADLDNENFDRGVRVVLKTFDL